MKKRLIPILILIAYCAILIKVMVFKDIPTIKIGQLMLNFGGTESGHPANFIPFTTIVPYLLGSKGLIIGGINIVGNIALLVPLGFLVMLIYPKMTWKKSLALGVIAGLTIETMQTVLHVGIFDIDDVILNALGVMIGFWAFIILAKWLRERNYKNILIAAILLIAAALAALYIVYSWGHPVNSGVGTVTAPQSGDLCGGTGGIGQIVSVGNDSITIQKKDGSNQIVTFSNEAVIKTSAGSASQSDLKVGEKVTLVGGPNPDGSFTADTVLVCDAGS